MKHFALCATSIAFAISTAGCCCFEKSIPLETTTWELEVESLQGVPTGTPKPEQDITIVIKDGKAYGYGGVNRYNTAVTVDQAAGKITFGDNIASTRAMGPAMPYENKYFTTLSNVDSYKIVGDNLYFYSKGTIVAEFEADMDPVDND